MWAAENSKIIQEKKQYLQIKYKTLQVFLVIILQWCLFVSVLE